MSKSMHRNRDKCSVEFSLYIICVSNLPEALSGSSVYISWKRGGRSGLSRQGLVRDGVAMFGETLVFGGTVFFTKTDETPDKKFMTLMLKTDGKVLAKVDFDLMPRVADGDVGKLPMEFAEIEFCVGCKPKSPEDKLPRVYNKPLPSVEAIMAKRSKGAVRVEPVDEGSLSASEALAGFGRSDAGSMLSASGTYDLTTTDEIVRLRNEIQTLRDDKLKLQKRNRELEEKISNLKKKYGEEDDDKKKKDKKVAFSRPTTSGRKLGDLPEHMGKSMIMRPRTSAVVKDEEHATTTANLELAQFIEKEIYCVRPEMINDIPVTAQNIFTAFRTWGVFTSQEAVKTNKVCDAMKAAVDASKGNTKRVCYWLSTVCALLRIINTYQPDSDEEIAAMKDVLTDTSGRLKNLLFQIYRDLVSDVFEQLRDYTVHAFLESKAFEEDVGLARIPTLVGHPSEFLFRPLKMAKLNMEINRVPKELVFQFFMQICYQIDAYVFNYILKTPKYCTLEKGFQLKIELFRMRDWLRNQNLGDCFEAFNPLQEISIIMITDKTIFSDTSACSEICPTLSVWQIASILAMFSDGLAAANKLRSKAPQTESPDVEIDEEHITRLKYSFLGETSL